MVVGRFQGQPHGRRERRLALARLACTQTPRGESERLAQGDLTVELARLVGIARQHQRAGAQIADVLLAGRLQLLGEQRPQLRRAQPQLEHPPAVLAELRLGDRREHACGDARGAAAGLLALEHGHRDAALTCAPCDRQTDHAAADHEQIGRFVRFGHSADASPRGLHRLDARGALRDLRR